MKFSSLSKAIGAGVISLSLATAPFIEPAAAQNAVQSSPGTTESNNPTFDTTPLQETKNDFNNFGWLGLLGLLGLVKLFQKQHHEPERYRDPNIGTSTGYVDPNAGNRPD